MLTTVNHILYPTSSSLLRNKDCFVGKVTMTLTLIIAISGCNLLKFKLVAFIVNYSESDLTYRPYFEICKVKHVKYQGAPHLVQ